MSCCHCCCDNFPYEHYEDDTTSSGTSRDDVVQFLAELDEGEVMDLGIEARHFREQAAEANRLWRERRDFRSVHIKTAQDRADEALERDRSLKRAKVETVVRLRARLNIPNPNVGGS